MPQKANRPHRFWTGKAPDYSKGQGRTYVSGFYQSALWRKVRMMHLRENPLCVECLKEGFPAPGNTVDHIKQVNQKDPFDTQNGKYGEPLDPDNLQTLCNSHHNKKSAKERHGKS